MRERADVGEHLPRAGRRTAGASRGGPAVQAQRRRAGRAVEHRPGRAADAGAGRQQASQRAPNAVEVRVTGFGRWKTVIVPPNAFVVHTRRGRGEPLHMGLGVSFRYNPATDSYLVVPGAMQTILINALLHLPGTAGRARPGVRAVDHRGLRHRVPQARLRRRRGPDAAGQPAAQGAGGGRDQGQGRDAGRQRRAQRQAADHRGAHRPAARRRRGRAAARDGGLGLRIVTVQIKEAVVSSSRLWENLQKPYRSEQGRIARLAELAADEAIGARELAAVRAAADPADRERAGARRAAGPQRGAAVRPGGRRAGCAGPQRQEEDSPRAGRPAGRDDPARDGPGTGTRRGGGRDRPAAHRTRDRAAPSDRRRRPRRGGRPRPSRRTSRRCWSWSATGCGPTIDNAQSPESIQAKLVDSLPEIVAKLPKPAELRRSPSAATTPPASAACSPSCRRRRRPAGDPEEAVTVQALPGPAPAPSSMITIRDGLSGSGDGGTNRPDGAGPGCGGCVVCGLG